jgi:hypothetical protein
MHTLNRFRSCCRSVNDAPCDFFPKQTHAIRGDSGGMDQEIKRLDNDTKTKKERKTKKGKEKKKYVVIEKMRTM